MKVTYDPINNIFVESEEDVLIPQVMWHITDECYLNCKFCFVKGRQKHQYALDKNTIENNMLLLKQMQTQKIDISGGEPLLFNDLQFLITIAKQFGFYLTITTRGIGTESNLKWLILNWNAFSRVIVSLDGYDGYSCNCLSGYINTYDSAMGFMGKLKFSGCNNLRINTVVNRLLINDNALKLLCDLILDISPYEWCLIQPHPLNRRESYDHCVIAQAEFDTFVDKIQKIITGNSAIKIITRSNVQYSKYWCIYPDNSIAKLSDQSKYSFIDSFNQSNIDCIKRFIISNSDNN